MAWQDVFPVSSPRINAEEDREQRLAAQARAGADWALTALVARYQPPVTRYLTRLTGNGELARALAARVFIRMERRLHGPEAGRNLRLWLLRASTEAGLDALRKPQHARATLLAAPKRPAGLLTDGASVKPVQRLRARIDALTQAALQTRRQVRKLVWAAMPDPEAAADLDATPDGESAGDARDPELMEALRRQDPREALRYRIVRAVLAELPYGDAQCLALHLVAGLNQAEVATALGLTNSATRRRIVQGLQLFSQRFNAAAASLGLAPDALAGHAAQSAPLEPGVGGYVPVQEQPTVTISSQYAATAGLAANGHAPVAPPAPVDAAVEAAPALAAVPFVEELPPEAGVIPPETVVDAAHPEVEEQTLAGAPAAEATAVDAPPATEPADEAAVGDAADGGAALADRADAALEDATPEAGQLATDAEAEAEAEADAEADAEAPSDAVAAAEPPVDVAAEPDETLEVGMPVSATSDTLAAGAAAVTLFAAAAALDAEAPAVNPVAPVDAAAEAAEADTSDAGLAAPADGASAELNPVAVDEAARFVVAEAAVAGVDVTDAWAEPELPAVPPSVDATEGAAPAAADMTAAEASAATTVAGTVPAGLPVIVARVVPVLTSQAPPPVPVPVRLVPVLTPAPDATAPAYDEGIQSDETEQDDE